MKVRRESGLCISIWIIPIIRISSDSFSDKLLKLSLCCIWTRNNPGRRSNTPICLRLAIEAIKINPPPHRSSHTIESPIWKVIGIVRKKSADFWPESGRLIFHFVRRLPGWNNIMRINLKKRNAHRIRDVLFPVSLDSERGKVGDQHVRVFPSHKFRHQIFRPRSGYHMKRNSKFR